MQKIPQSLFLTPNQSINDALIAINSEPRLKIAIVVNFNKNLLGTVTDGDVRRGLLANEIPKNSVVNIMNPNPITALVGATRAELAQEMKVNGIDVILLTNEGSLVGLESRREFSKTRSYDNPVFIMAGGFGTRLRPLTDDCPKPMLKVGDKPILETQIDRFISLGFSDFYISTHYLPEIIKDFFGDGSSKGVKITYVHEESPLGTGGALGLLPKKNMSISPVIVINGDILTKIDYREMVDFHLERKSDATMCVREYEYQVPFGVVNGGGYEITSMTEKPVQRFFINAGIYIINHSVIEAVAENIYLDLPTLLEMQIAAGKKILKFPVYEYWLDIGRKDDFDRAQVDYSTLGF